MTKPNKIVHCADVHLFLSKNFHVHDFVFNEFYKQIEEIKPDLIVLAGDIIDSKLRLSPEQVTLARNFFLNLSSYAPLIIILGNHDLNLANKDREDSLSPILYSCYNECINPIHFLKHSGIYNLYGIDWAVWSCLDNQKSPFTVDKKSSAYTIGLFHGTVEGVYSDSGIKLTGAISIDEFKECDTVFLGDIHSPQSFRNDTIKYSGSFLQVTVSEEANGSYLLWELKGDKYVPSLKRIKNIYSTVSHEITDLNDFDVKELQNENQLLNLRYSPSLFKKTDVLEYKKELAAKYKNQIEIKPFIVKKEVSQETNLSKEEIEKIKRSTLEEAFKEYVNRKQHDFDSSLLFDLDSKFSQNVDSSKEFEIGDFAIESIAFTNFLTYRDTVFTFDKAGTYSIIGSNRSGKSSVLNGLRFCLFNSGNNNGSLRGLINKHNRTKPAAVEVILQKNGKRYSIKRTIQSRKDNETVSIDLDFFQIDNHHIRSHRGEKRQETEKEIQKLFGIESFFDILSFFSAQKKQIEFIDCKNAERLTLINKFLGLQQFAEKEEGVKVELKEKKIIYQELLKGFDESLNLKTLEEELFLLNESKLNDENLLHEKNLVFDKFIKQNEPFMRKWRQVQLIADKQVFSPEAIKEEIKNIDIRIQSKKDKIANNSIEFKILNKQLDEVKDSFFSTTQVDIKDWVPDYKETKALERIFAVNDNELDKLKRQIELDICNNCGKEFSDADKQKCFIESGRLVKENNKIEEEIEKKETVLKNKIDKQNLYNSIGRKMSNVQTEILTITNEITKLESEKDKLKSKDSEYKEVEEAKEILNFLAPQMEKYLATKKVQEKEILSLNISIGSTKDKINNKNKDITVYKSKFYRLQEIENEMEVLKEYKETVAKDGLPLYILKSKISLINEQVNMIISQVFDFDIEFKIDEAAGDLDIKFIYPDDVEAIDISSASGAETFIINLCIKVGLAQISELPKLNSLLIDEGFGTLDKNSIEKIPALFTALNQYYKNIILISHLEELKDMSDFQVRLERKNRYTEVV